MGKMLTVDQVSERTNRSPRAIRLLMHRKKIPYSKFVGRLFVDEDELDLFLALSRKITAAEAAGRQVDV